MSVPELGLTLQRRPGNAALAPADGGGGLVACEVCLREVPRSEAVVPEAADYVAYFCGLRCFEQWKKPPQGDPSAH
jgi:hypothetical protein